MYNLYCENERKPTSQARLKRNHIRRNMCSVDKPVFITQSYYSSIKCRLKYAEKGHSLLKKRSDGLMMKFRLICSQIFAKKSDLEILMKNASILLAEVKFLGGSVGQTIIQGVNNAKLKILSMGELIGGIKVTKFQLLENNIDPYEFAGLSRGGQQILKLKENYRIIIEHLVELASLQQAFLVLDNAIRRTNLRVNALRHTIIPKLEHTLSYLSWELDEQEREQFFRMKKICNKKNIAAMKTEGQKKEIIMKSAYDDTDEDLLF